MKALPKTLTHLAAVGIGMALAVTTPGLLSNKDQAANNTSTTTSANGDNKDAATRKAGTTAPSGGRAAEFRRAWAALGSQKLPTPKLRALQRKLLEEWAEVDLQGAMEAALGEAWDSWENSYGSPYGNRSGHPLGDAFAKAFAEHPLDAWKVLSSDKLGPGAQLLRRGWVYAVSRKDASLVISMLPELPNSLRGLAIVESMRQVPQNKPEERDAMLKKISTSGDLTQSTNWLQTAFYQFNGPIGETADLRARWVDAPAGSDRAIAITAWASSLRGVTREQFATEWANVPESSRGEAAKSILSQLQGRFPLLLEVVDQAIEAGEWAYLEKGVAHKIPALDPSQPGTDPKSVADWALKLPAREEATDLFHSAIQGYLVSDPDQGRTLLESLPAGDWHRERGFIELSQTHLWRRNDPEGSRRAIDSITDPVAKQIATTYLYDWQLLTNRPITRQ
ncbi:hypothetical protein [Luteolibacter soli]|uniref:DUF4034 domain-containing protein n=1 Tax=Luteolibacter soli TaxID=3135280 RepID=A0ABU9AUW8_9BACT